MIARISRENGRYYWTVYDGERKPVARSNPLGYGTWDEALASFDQTKELFATVERPGPPGQYA